ncbi:type II toxin-antitoxin system Phd/YefM family antitoxin [Nocardiopsis sp. FR26]|uniref:type II toxin-antitoxin system Phd/YefM family antitoxin n=1 Tax=Nocardiopsis sp. FR26 TaxID=2605987 RepID=UPI00135CD162|nr:type II toxin-antitoxin system Phd/YefM family antitoxin [Nocardiopsis sp. FR26]
MPTSHETPVTVSQARDELGALVERVATTGRRIPLTRHDQPAGALISMNEANTALQMPISGAHGITDAIASWAQVRRAAEHHPQALVLPSRGVAVLIGPDLVHRLEHGHPPLPDLKFDGDELRTADGTPVTPGTYAVDGRVVNIYGPEDAL